MVCSHLPAWPFWLVVLPAAAFAVLAVKRGRGFLEYVEDRTREPPDPPAAGCPSVALIVPVKGAEEGLAENLRSLARQDHPDFELVVCCADDGDPGLEVARSVLGPDCRTVIAGPPPPDTGEKVHNLLAATAAAGSAPDILAFADSDGRVPSNWLGKLVAPLDDHSLGAATAFRWYFPENGGFWSLLRTVWDSAIATVMDIRDRSVAWGGGTAVRREAFESARVPEFWRGTVSDDCRLTAAMEAAGLGVRFVPEAMVQTTGQTGGREFLEWIVRQATVVRVYRFRLWLGGCLSHILYCLAQAMCVLQALQGHWIGLGALLLVTLPGMAIGGMRGHACLLIFPEREAWIERYGWAYFWMAPLATWVWLYAFLRSGLTRRIAWRGRVYELRSETRAREIGRG